MNDVKNENWGECPKCGSPVLIVANGEPENCANCRSQSSRWGLYLGGVMVMVGVIGVIYLVYAAIRMLMLKA